MISHNKTPYEEKRDAYINILLGEKAYWADKTHPVYGNEHKRIKEIVELILFRHSKELELAWRTGRDCLFDAAEGRKEKITLGSFLAQIGATEREPPAGAIELE